MPAQDKAENALLLGKIGGTVGLNHREVGKILGVARRTFTHWVGHGTYFSAEQAVKLARLVHRKDRAMAERFAAIAGHSLVSLGLESASAPPGPASPKLADAVVCAAAEALDVSPRAVRPALLAAVKYAREVGFTIEQLEATLAASAPTTATP